LILHKKTYGSDSHLTTGELTNVLLILTNKYW